MTFRRSLLFAYHLYALYSIYLRQYASWNIYFIHHAILLRYGLQGGQRTASELCDCTLVAAAAAASGGTSLRHWSSFERLPSAPTAVRAGRPALESRYAPGYLAFPLRCTGAVQWSSAASQPVCSHAWACTTWTHHALGCFW